MQSKSFAYNSAEYFMLGISGVCKNNTKSQTFIYLQSHSSLFNSQSHGIQLQYTSLPQSQKCLGVIMLYLFQKQ
jgi:hypothetical protein